MNSLKTALASQEDACLDDISDATELDALGLDDEPIGENETPSYLQDATALPDFIDAAPAEESHVGKLFFGPCGLVYSGRLKILQQTAPTAEVAR